jgi:hypothetical protein
MPFKSNYRFNRMERDRLKQAKKEDKLRRRQERKSEHDDPEVTNDAGPTAKDEHPL